MLAIIHFSTDNGGITCPFYTGSSLPGPAEDYCCRKETMWKHNGFGNGEALAALIAGLVMLLSYAYLFLYLRPRIAGKIEADNLRVCAG